MLYQRGPYATLDDTPAARNGNKEYCPQGHPYEGSNLGITPDGYRYCLTCKREQNHTYRARNSDKIFARKRTHRACNRDKLAAYKAWYRARNRDKIRTQRAAYRAAHRDVINARKREASARKQAEAVPAQQVRFRRRLGTAAHCELSSAGSASRSNGRSRSSPSSTGSSEETA